MIQMIRGIDVLLHSAEGDEAVSNVLVGEPADGGFTLAIPKGDGHIWTDTSVSFFGRRFRTVGFPQEGIEQNIPLSWNKKVKVQPLTTNADLTVYEFGSYARHVYSGVLFTDTRGRNVAKSGEQTAGSAEIKLYAPNISDSYVPKIGDIAVGRACEFEFDTSSERAVSESFRRFRELCPDYAVISAAVPALNAEKFDYTITAR